MDRVPCGRLHQGTDGLLFGVSNVPATTAAQCDEIELLRNHLFCQELVEGPTWLQDARAWRFEVIREPLDWDNSVMFAHLVDNA